MCPTIHGNMLVGPTAEDLDNKTDKSVTKEGLDSILKDVKNLIPNVNVRDSITQYSGLRPNRNPEGLHVDIYDDLKGYINLSGVRSTGLTLSVAMGVYVADVMREMGAPMVFKENFISTRKGIVRFHELSREEQDEIVKENPAYGRVICRCETIIEGEILDGDPQTAGCKKRRCGKTPCKSRNGSLSGRFLRTKGHRDLSKRTGYSGGRSQ